MYLLYYVQCFSEVGYTCFVCEVKKSKTHAHFAVVSYHVQISLDRIIWPKIGYEQKMLSETDLSVTCSRLAQKLIIKPDRKHDLNRY